MPPMSRTRQIILETLNHRGPLPLGEIARAARHSPMATRYHLGLLVDAGLVTANDQARREIVGRPQVLYALTERAHMQLPKRYDALAEQLLEELAGTLGEKETRALLRRAGRRLAEAAPSLRRGTRIETRAQRAADFLSARGYSARWGKSDGALTMWVSNCPYRGVALAHRQVCEMDIALIGTLVDSQIRMTRCLATQDAQCAFVVKLTRVV
jgi:predicted ArsR family transcriptional regulator